TRQEVSMHKEWAPTSRRDFLKFTGKMAAASVAFLSGCAQNSIQPARQSPAGVASAIDIHHHYIPPELMTRLNAMVRRSASNTFHQKMPRIIRSRSDFQRAIGSIRIPAWQRSIIASM